MSKVIPKEVSGLFEKVRIERFWWDGVQVNIPFHCIYAVIPNPIPNHYTEINGLNVPILKLGSYHVPIWDPMHNELKQVPKMAVVLTHQEGEKFGLYAYPADCQDESYSLSYDDWFARQKLNE
jgi:hypothetical protein